MLKITAGFDLGLPPPPRPGAATDPTRRGQCKRNWCWAACLQMLLEILVDKFLKQCRIVELVLMRRPDKCCSGVDNCDFSRLPEQIVDALRAVELRSDPPQGVLDFVDLDKAVHPVAIGLTRPGGGHMLLIFDVTSNKDISILDPSSLEKGKVTYQFLVADHPLGEWSHTWINITPRL